MKLAFRYNATVLAYGQTGSGKTFTMGCGNNVSLLEEELGILPRAIRQLYENVEERSNQAEFLIKCAYVEIYNEEIKDLLHPDTPSKSIFIREDANGDIVLAGVKEEVVTNFENMIRFLEHGSVFRTTGSTLMNQHSSRSHAIFTIIVVQRSIVDCGGSNDVITAKFHLVDLAGSGRAKRTGAVGMRFKKSVTINCGLLALGNVISALGDAEGLEPFKPLDRPILEQSTNVLDRWINSANQSLVAFVCQEMDAYRLYTVVISFYNGELYEDELCLCILDINPLSVGHSLVSPKSHFSCLESTPPQVAAAMCAMVPRISRALLAATHCDINYLQLVSRIQKHHKLWLGGWDSYSGVRRLWVSSLNPSSSQVQGPSTSQVQDLSPSQIEGHNAANDGDNVSKKWKIRDNATIVPLEN